MKDVVIWIENWKHEIIRARCKHCRYFARDIRSSTRVIYLGYCECSFDKYGQVKPISRAVGNFACSRFYPNPGFKIADNHQQLCLTFNS